MIPFLSASGMTSLYPVLIQIFFPICDDNHDLQGMIPGSTAAVKQFSSIQGKGEKSQIQADREMHLIPGRNISTDVTGPCLEGACAPLGQTLNCRSAKIWKGSRRTGKWNKEAFIAFIFFGIGDFLN